MDDRALDAYEKALVVLGYFFMLARIIGEYFMGISFHSLLGDISEIAFSFALVLTLKVLFSGRSSTNHLAAGAKKVVSFFDTISYEVYLMHHMFILGGLTVMHLTRSGPLNISIALVLTIASAMLLQKCSSWITSAMTKRRK